MVLQLEEEGGVTTRGGGRGVKELGAERRVDAGGVAGDERR